MKTCLYRLFGEEKCKDCKMDYDANHHPNNADCKRYYEVNMVTFSVDGKSEEKLEGDK